MSSKIDRLQALLDAGALLEPGATLSDPSKADRLLAKGFKHAGLGDRVVVRLSP